MAAVQIQGTSSSSVSRCAYDVFLSFRGPDTRTTFTDYLYTNLVNAGIHTFRDDDELRRGENIQSELQKAIKESRISVIVFSKGYASSRWCLDELMEINERRKTSRHHVLPVFYHVDPSDVRKQTGSFQEAFAEHKRRFNEEKLKGWKAALKEVADLAGMELKNGHESKFIQKIIREIRSKLNRRVMDIPPHTIGTDSQVEDISLWLQDGSVDVGILVIYGIGGIGKTTIAKAVYNQNYDKFDGSSFLANIREASKHPNGLVPLQEQFISNILKLKKNKIDNVDEGIQKIRDAICHKRILLILDDVNHSDQLNALLGIREFFFPGSKIIVTTRHKKLPKTSEPFKMHKVKELSEHESIQLFSWHAFGRDHPSEGYADISRRVVKYCRGIPLALEVLGSSLMDRTVEVWESALQKLEEIPDSQIIDKLIISFESLKDDHEKNIFLDVTCFFVGEDIDFVITILDQCYPGTKYDIDNLIDKCLLTIDDYNKVTVHQLLQDMGREIVRRESPDEPGERSRLWRHKDVLNVLEEKCGTRKIQGLIFNLEASQEEKYGKTFLSVNNANRCHSEEFCNNSALYSKGNSFKRRRLDPFSWFRTNFPFGESSSASNRVDLKTDAFSPMHKLRILHLNNVQLIGGYQLFPKKLRWLQWHGFSLKSIPNEFFLESLVVLEMRYSCLEEVWKGSKFLKSLKILDLSHSHVLLKTPDFSNVPNLVNLSFEDCINLIEVHESIVELRRLVLLNLEGCKNLRKLPINFGQLKSVEKLVLSGCSKLCEIPTDLRKMESLKVLKADRIAINALPFTTAEVSSWRSLFGSWVSKPREIPDSIRFSLALPCSLTILHLQECNLTHDALPKDIGSLSSLRDLNLSRNPICFLPESIEDLNVLEFLNLDYCRRLQSLPKLPTTLKVLKLQDCNLSDEAFPKDIGRLSLLRTFDLSGNPICILPESIKDLTSLESLDLASCRRLRYLPKLPMSINSLNLSACESFEKLTNLPNSLELRDLRTDFCDKLVEIEGWLKLEPIGNYGAELISKLGLFDLESTKNIEVELFNYHTFAKRKFLVQGVYDFGILSTFLPVSEVPSWFEIKSIESSVLFNVPKLPNLKIGGLNMCVVYYSQPSEEFDDCYGNFINEIVNMSKHLRWLYHPRVQGVPDDNKDMMWLSYWKIGNQLDGGDEVSVSLIVSEPLQLKEIGIRVVYEEEDRGSNTSIQSYWPLGEDASPEFFVI